MPKIINWTEYRKHSEEWFKGKKVRTRTEIETISQKIPAGSVLTIVEKFKGFTLKSEPCACCGVSVHVRKVDGMALDLLDDGDVLAVHGCTWTQNEDGVYQTGCGNLFEFNEGTPAENEFRFCCYCGQKLVQGKLMEEE